MHSAGPLVLLKQTWNAQFPSWNNFIFVKMKPQQTAALITEKFNFAVGHILFVEANSLIVSFKLTDSN